LVIHRNTLGKNERLKSRKLIEAVFSKGKSFTQYPFRISYLTTELSFPLQAGFAVSSKNFKKAVDRNRIKRLTREAWRLQKQSLLEQLLTQKKQLAIFFIYTGKELPEYSMISAKMHLIIEKLHRIADENDIAHT
jgi:ribonuclease P protein component